MKTIQLGNNLRGQRHWLPGIVAGGVFWLACLVGAGRAADAPGAAGVLQDLRSFKELGSVLFIAAHPDDENTQLITYLARGRGYRMAYLSLTRGDGGQNLLGPEFGAELGIARTQELLAARRLDGGQQFFTRAMDFGFSKDYQETLHVWDRQQVLADVVRVIRRFRPDVLINRFSTQPGNTHGHHTASAVLGLEAFKLAGDPKAFPEQLGGEMTAWQPKRIFVNGGAGGRGGGGGAGAGGGTGGGGGTIQMDVSGNDPVSGESFATIAARSRAMHKTQGFGNNAVLARAAGARSESFTLLDGEPATKDIMDGVDTTWGRVPGGAEVGTMTEALIASFNAGDLSANVPALLEIKKRAAVLPADRVVDEKRRQLDRILKTCLGIHVETVVANGPVVPGEAMKLTHTVVLSSNFPVGWLGLRYPSLKNQMGSSVIELQPNVPATRDNTLTLPQDTPVTQPYWLRQEPTAGMFQVADASLIGQAENGPAVPVDFIFFVGGQRLIVPDEPVEVSADPSAKPPSRRMDVIAPVSLHFVSEVRLLAPGATRPVEVELTAYRANTAGTVRLDVPAGWKATPDSQPFHVAASGEHARVTFNLTAPGQPAVADVTVHAQVGGATYSSDRSEIHYAHIPPQLLQPTARLKVVCLEMATRGHQVGYVPGAGDSVAEALEEMGYAVTPLTGADLTPEKLKGLDAVVIGVRAFNVRKDLQANLPALFDFAQAGGNVIVQYNRPDGLPPGTKFAPYDLRVSGDRVTDEHSAVTLLAPDHPAFNTPNKITPADFDGWVQERGIYFPNQWDEHFVPLIAWNDAGEAPLKGALLVAPYGKGNFVYTSIVWFRELPAGVPGAYRLFANLVSLGK